MNLEETNYIVIGSQQFTTFMNALGFAHVKPITTTTEFRQALSNISSHTLIITSDNWTEEIKELKTDKRLMTVPQEGFTLNDTHDLDVMTAQVFGAVTGEDNK